MLADLTLETSNAPGNAATINLAGAPAGRLPFSFSFASGASCYYVMDDGVQQEIGIGTFTAGSPNTLGRTTVLWNSAVGSTSPGRLTFSGSTRVYNSLPSKRTIYADAGNLVTLPGGLAVPGGATVVNAPTTSTGVVRLGDMPSAAGFQGFPAAPSGVGNLLQSGFASTPSSGLVTVLFPTAFPNAVLSVVCSVSAQPSIPFDVLIGAAAPSVNGFEGISCRGGALLGGIGFYWMAWGH